MATTLFASRAGEKLAFALEYFQVDVKGKVCADFGSSTGGFVDALGQAGATKIYAVETGYGVLDWKLRKNPSVVVLERTNAMHVILPEKVAMITNDTSWTRQAIIFPNILANLKDGGSILTLIKPHYEADPKLLHHGVLEEAVAEVVANDCVKKLTNLFPVMLVGLVKSPLLGSKGGNTEFLALFQLSSRSGSPR